MLNGAYSLDYRVAGTVFLAELHFYFSVILKDFFQHSLKNISILTRRQLPEIGKATTNLRIVFK